MNSIICLLLTYPISLVLKILNIKDIVNDASKNGYLVNVDKFRERGNDNEDKYHKYLTYIPLLNVIDSIISLIDYKSNREILFEQYRIYGYFDPMTKEEEEYYRTTYKTIEEYLPNRKYQYYLFLLDICETDNAIKEHLWKRKYELNDFWIHTLRKPE